MFKHILVCTAFVMMAIVNPVIAQQSTPTSEKAKQIEALVNEAAALIESQGKAAFEEFRKKDTHWFNGDTYLFVYDLSRMYCSMPLFLLAKGATPPVRKIPMASYLITTLFR